MKMRAMFTTRVRCRCSPSQKRRIVSFILDNGRSVTHPTQDLLAAAGTCCKAMPLLRLAALLWQGQGATPAMYQLLMRPNIGTVSSNGTHHPFASRLFALRATSDTCLCIHRCCASTSIDTYQVPVCLQDIPSGT